MNPLLRTSLHRRLVGLALASGLLVFLSPAIQFSRQPNRATREFIWIDEMSMAPTLMGAHHNVRCTHCERVQGVAPYDQSAQGAPAVCIGCGQPFSLPAPPPLRPGDRLAIETVEAGQGWQPDRWQVVTFVAPVSELRATSAIVTPKLTPATWIKRVVGLPGEYVELRDGDLWANGQVVAKSLDDLRRMAIPVCETNCTQPHLGIASAWLSRAEARDFNFCGPQSLGRHTSGCLLWDELSCEPLRSQALHPVRDLAVQVDVMFPTAHRGRLLCELSTAGATWRFAWDAERCHLTVDCNQTRIATRRVLGLHTAERMRWEFAYCDRQVLAAVEGHSQLVWPDTRPIHLPHDPMEAQADGLQRLRVRVLQGDAKIQRLGVARDIHYAGDTRDTPARWQLANDECLVLGDNPAGSIDSRRWGPLPVAQIRAQALPATHAAPTQATRTASFERESM